MSGSLTMTWKFDGKKFKKKGLLKRGESFTRDSMEEGISVKWSKGDDPELTTARVQGEQEIKSTHHVEI